MSLINRYGDETFFGESICNHRLENYFNRVVKFAHVQLVLYLDRSHWLSDADAILEHPQGQSLAIPWFTPVHSF